MTSMEGIVQQRCYHHARREAVARCPECHRFFCRECVTEHDDRVICAACLRKITGADKKDHRRWRSLGVLASLCMGVLVVWITFFWLGKTLLAIPTSFHDGTLWHSTTPTDDD